MFKSSFNLVKEFAEEKKIFDFVTEGLSRLSKNRQDLEGLYSPLSLAVEMSTISINLGRQAGHTLASSMLYGHYTKLGYKVFVISHNISCAMSIRDMERVTGVYVPKNHCFSIRTALNPDTWRGITFDKTIFIMDNSMKQLSETVESIAKMESFEYAHEKPFFIGLGRN